MNNNIQSYVNRAKQNLSAADLLLQEGFNEIAASRANYAMFYLAEALLLTKGLAFSSHSAVISAYGKEFARSEQIKSIHHRHLIDAFETRLVGDYGVEKEITSPKASELIAWGKEFLNDAESFLQHLER